MSIGTLIYRFIVTNVLTLFYSGLVLIKFAWEYLKNPFGDPWAQKLRLQPPPPLTDPKYGVHKYIKANNVKLHYVESGDPSKPLMIFVHGFPEFWYSWRYQIVEFNKDYWCIAIDLRGYGDSERPDGTAPYKIDLLVEDIRDLIRVLGREKCVLVTHDWGGLIGARFRDTHPDALNAFVMLGSVSLESFNKQMWNNYEQMKMSWYVFLYRMPAIPEMLLTMNNLKIFDIAMKVKGKTTINDQDLECFKYWFCKPTAFTPPINFYRSNYMYIANKKQKCELAVPFLLVLARGDKYISLKHIDSMKENYEHIDTVVIDDCGHFLQQEEPERINKIVREFLVKYKV